MAKTFKPITINLIEEGRLVASLDEELARVTRALIGHVKKYGKDAAKKARAELALKIVVRFEGGEDASDYSVSAAISGKLPGRPVHATLALHEQEQTGEDTLFVRASGSSTDSPRQMRIATDDGRAVDPVTGEIMEPKAPKGRKDNA